MIATPSIAGRSSEAFRRCLIGGVLAWSCAPGLGWAQSPATVRLAGGRTFSAPVDPRTDAQRLWLRFGSGTTTILRPIAWTAIVDVVHDARRYSGTAFREFALQPAFATSPASKPNAPRLVRRADEAAPPAHGGGLRLWNVPAAHTASMPAPAIATIAVDANLAQWDADVEFDGLVVSLAALDSEGLAVGFRGTAEIELLGPATAPLTTGNGFPVLGRWTRAITPETSGDGYARLRLEFQAFHPDWSRQLLRHGVVHVRLHVPGRGTFESSVDAVPLRGYTPTRDYVEQAFGTRFLPNERTGRGTREASRQLP